MCIRDRVEADEGVFVATDLDSSEMIAVLGLEDVVVVRTKDATLVASSEKAQEIKKLVETLPADYR